MKSLYLFHRDETNFYLIIHIYCIKIPKYPPSLDKRTASFIVDCIKCIERTDYGIIYKIL